MGQVTTIEDAFQKVGERLQQADLPAKARAALASNSKYEVLITVKPARQGGVVSMDARVLAPAESLGSFIRLK